MLNNPFYKICKFYKNRKSKESSPQNPSFCQVSLLLMTSQLLASMLIIVGAGLSVVLSLKYLKTELINLNKAANCRENKDFFRKKHSEIQNFHSALLSNTVYIYSLI